jgi:nicotinamidase/pyrazinamidase
LKKALVLVDLQNDFIPGGSLAVREGDQVIPVANAAQKKKWDVIVATQDWHPKNHGSFASNHRGKHPGDMIELGGLPQVLWPDHCVQGSRGAEFHAVLDRSRITKIFKKGTDPEIDSYSTFFDNAHRKSTGLGDWLKEQKITDVYLLGLATDYCVKYSALDSVHLGFKTHVIIDGCRGVELEPGDTKKAVEEMKKAGVEIVSSGEL